MIVKSRLSAPADMEGGENICQRPVHYLAKLFPVVNILKLHLLNRCASDDKTVKALVLYVVKGGIELVEM